MTITIKQLVNCLFLLLFIGSSTTVSASMGIDEVINTAVQPLTTVISAVIFFKVPLFGADFPLVVLWLVAGAIFSTFYFGFINLSGFKHALELVRGDYDSPKDRGEVSHFQALATAVSGTVGIGNIGGVAVAYAQPRSAVRGGGEARASQSPEATVSGTRPRAGLR